MSSFEISYPDVVFIYMTGHLDGSGEAGNLHLRNEQIRQFCKDNDSCDYDSCGSAHSQGLNANMKAYAAWWLFVQIAGDV